MPDIDEWSVEKTRAEETVIQPNSFDCGVLQMLYVAYLSKALPINFECKDCELGRRRIAYEIISNCLLTR